MWNSTVRVLRHATGDVVVFTVAEPPTLSLSRNQYTSRKPQQLSACVSGVQENIQVKQNETTCTLSHAKWMNMYVRAMMNLSCACKWIWVWCAYNQPNRYTKPFVRVGVRWRFQICMQYCRFDYDSPMTINVNSACCDGELGLTSFVRLSPLYATGTFSNHPFPETPNDPYTWIYI